MICTLFLNKYAHISMRSQLKIEEIDSYQNLLCSKIWSQKREKSTNYVLKKRQYWIAYMEEMLQITKAPIAKIWHILKAKSIAALEKYVNVPRFGQAPLEKKLSMAPVLT